MSLPRLPLYAQFLGWSLFNLVLLTGLLFVFAGRDGLGLEMLLTDPARERAQGVGFALSRQLEASPEARWPDLLAEFSAAYHARFELERPTPRTRDGEPRFARPPHGWPAPPESEPGPPAAGPGFGGSGFRPGFGPGFGPRRTPSPPPNGAFVRIERKDGRYQLHIPLALEARHPDERRALLVTADGLWPLLRFLGLSEWVGLLFGALVVSALWWWPFFYGITRRISRLTRVTERIAEGRLTERALPGRPDELGSLARSVNLMGEQLHAKVEGQRQFLLDVAHELTSPLARMQFGLAIAQDELPESEARRLTPVLDDAQQMSELLQDLLQFSRENRSHQAARVERVEVRSLVEGICVQEAGNAAVSRDLPLGLEVLADRALTARALGNLVRNAVRHGGGSAIEVSAAARGNSVEIRVADRGPGVPAAALPHLGEPFYRPDVARDRDTGGVGLGLAIVRRCVERSGGQVLFANRQGGGFEARVELPSAPRTGSDGGASPFE